MPVSILASGRVRNKPRIFGAAGCRGGRVFELLSPVREGAMIGEGELGQGPPTGAGNRAPLVDAF
jgi:hypothetical protein